MEPGDDTRFTPAPPTRRPPRDVARSRKRPPLRLIALLALAVIAGLVTWLITGRGDNKSSKSSGTAQTVSSEKDLQKLVASLDVPVYWAGPQEGVRYELQKLSSGQIYLRYLTGKMKSGKGTTLTVGTYPMRNAYATTLALGKKSGWTQLETGENGAVAFTNSANPRNVYLAQSGLNYQIEVYDPTAGRAIALVQAGKVLQVAQGERLGLTLTGLKAKVASLGSTVYWIGPKSGVTYEFTRNPNGNVYLRYLPKGVAVGTGALYATIGTYPMSNALATTKAAGGRAGAVRVTLAGGKAFYTNSKPTSVYVAFTGSDYQIEVYDPVAAKALAAVKSGQLRPVS